MSARNMKLHASARRRLLRGADLLARTVTVTLGPRGRNVVIENPLGAPSITKDGVTVAREIELADRFANTGARLIREVAMRSSTEAGDGTTTVMVLAHAILREGVKAVAAGLDPMEVKRGIDVAVDAAVADIRRRARKVATGAQLAGIATIAANGDRDLGRLLSQAIAAAGDDGAITVEEVASRTARTSMPFTISACMLLSAKPAARRTKCWIPRTSVSDRPVIA